MIPVDHIVRQMLIFEGKEPKGRDYTLYLEFALMGVRELQNDFEVVGEKTVQITPIDSTLRTASIPKDYVMWKSVGYLCGNTYTRMYHDSQLMNFFLKDDCGNPIAPTNCDNYAYWYWYSVNGFYGYPLYDAYYDGRLYGMGGGSNNGGFNIEGDTIIFNKQADLTGRYPIIMVYAPSGINPDGNTSIHDYAAEALRAFIRYQKAVNANIRKLGEIDMMKALFEREKKLAKFRIYSLPIAEIADRLRQSTQGAPTF